MIVNVGLAWLGVGKTEEEQTQILSVPKTLRFLSTQPREWWSDILKPPVW